MMIAQGGYRISTVDLPPSSPFEDHPQFFPNGGEFHLTEPALSALRRFLPFNDQPDADDETELTDPPIDAFSCDEFRIYEFKVRRCARVRSHDWTECPYAHPGEKARRRDPRKFHYSGVACPEFRKGNCKRGDSCEFAHGVFECWLHPARYRTQPCKDGTACRRRVCFFAHTPDQLRCFPHQKQRIDSYDGSPIRLDSLSPTSTLMSPRDGSPPVSPVGSNLIASMRNLQIRQFGSNGIGFRSGLRAKMYERLSKEIGPEEHEIGAGPDVGWVSELIM